MSAAKAKSNLKPSVRAPVLRDVPAVSRAIAILRILSRSDIPQGVSQLAKELDMIPSTCLHILRVLTAEGLISFDEGIKKYQISSGIVSLAHNALRRNNFRNVATPHLAALTESRGVTAIATEPLGLDYQTVVAISRSEKVVSLHVDIGSRYPALISARCVAAFGNHSAKEIEQRFHLLRWDNPPSFSEWKADVERTRAEGYAVDQGNYIAGVTILAAPVWMPNKIINTVVIIGLQKQLEKIGHKKLGDDLRDRAKAITLSFAGGV
jgi:DNA-binding IclR family transcriptional regulator